MIIFNKNGVRDSPIDSLSLTVKGATSTSSSLLQPLPAKLFKRKHKNQKNILNIENRNFLQSLGYKLKKKKNNNKK